MVLALTSSTLTPSASCTRVTPPLPFLSTPNTPSSLITMSTTRRPVSGRVHSPSSFEAPSLETCSMVTITRFTPATRSIAPPMPLTILPGIIQLAIRN